MLALLGMLSGCGGREPADAPGKPDWIIASHVAFLAADGKPPRTAPRVPLRLWMPYVVGDIYGAPNAGELDPVVLAPDLAFTVDLNKSHEKLQKLLVPTVFSQQWMALEPATARIARLSPFVMPQDGIAPVGLTEWIDADTGSRLMLIYIDRAARLRGEIVYEGRNLQFDIDAPQAGYLWIQQPEGSGAYRAVPRPANLTLAVMPHG